MHGDQPAGHAEPRVRSVAINFEDALWVAGMDLLRRAYVKIVPETAPFFVTGHQGEIEQRSLAAALVAFFNAGLIGAASIGAIVSIVSGFLHIRYAARYRRKHVPSTRQVNRQSSSNIPWFFSL